MVRHMRTGYMGYYNDGGVFYATHNSSGRPLSRPVKIAIGAGIGVSLGAGIGDLLGHGREGALIGAGLGAIFGAKHGKKNQSQQDGMIPVEIDQEAYRPISNPDDVVGSNKEKTFWPVKNRSGFRVELWTGNEFAGLLQPSETIRIENPDGMTAVMLVPGPGGKIQKVRGEVFPNQNFSGWDIIVPTEGVR